MRATLPVRDMVDGRGLLTLVRGGLAVVGRDGGW